MSTEQKNDPETTALATKLTTGWEQFKQGKLVSYKAMAVILLVVAGVGLWLYIRSEQASAASKPWNELEAASSLAALEEFAKANPNTIAGRVAELHAARQQLGPDGIDKLVTREEGERKRAVESIGKAREAMTQLADAFKGDPVLRAECYLGLAKAEAALIGLNGEGKSVGGVAAPGESLGSPAKVVEWLDKLAEVADGTPWGDDAKKLSASLKNPTGPITEELKRVQTNLYNTALLPSLPPRDPFSPGGAPPGGGFPNISGLPGGGPSLAPPAAPTPGGAGAVVLPPAVTPAPTPPAAPPTPPPAPPKAPPPKAATPPAPPAPPVTAPTPPPTPPAPVPPPPKPPAEPKK